MVFSCFGVIAAWLLYYAIINRKTEHMGWFIASQGLLIIYAIIAIAHCKLVFNQCDLPTWKFFAITFALIIYVAIEIYFIVFIIILCQNMDIVEGDQVGAEPIIHSPLPRLHLVLTQTSEDSEGKSTPMIETPKLSFDSN
jgi:hypothetical protein